MRHIAFSVGVDLPFFDFECTLMPFFKKICDLLRFANYVIVVRILDHQTFCQIYDRFMHGSDYNVLTKKIRVANDFFYSEIDFNFFWICRTCLLKTEKNFEKNNFLQTFCKLFCHACLHIVGFSHNDEKNKQIMFSKEREIVYNVLEKND